MATTPSGIVKALLDNPRDEANVASLVAKDATYVSLNSDNSADVKTVLPYTGTHRNAGPAAILSTFTTVDKIWSTEAFNIETIFDDGKENAAIFGTFTYKSRNLGQAANSPFSIWARVKEGKIVYMQFMEDTLASTQTFRAGGVAEYELVGGERVSI